MKNTRGKYLIINNQLENIRDLSLRIDSGKKFAYEVLKLIDTIPLFFAEHYARLQSSAKKANISFQYSPLEMLKAITTLSENNGFDTGNVEILTANDFTVLRFIPHFYPAPSLYKSGVRVGFFYVERNNPNAKLKNQKLRGFINNHLKKNNLYEVLLITRQGNITEGSRSNVMFVGKDNKIYTAPENQILKGITRKIVLQICQQHKIEVIEKAITKRDLPEFTSAFLTGTSPGVLPIRNIGHAGYCVENDILRKLMATYGNTVAEEVKRNKVL